VKDGSGRTLATYEKDIFGNYIVKDGEGHVIVRFEKDIFGNTNVKNEKGEKIEEYSPDSSTDPKHVNIDFVKHYMIDSFLKK